MNRYPLNARTLGSGVSTPNKYWTAVSSIVVNAVDGFVVLTGAAWTSVVSVSVTAADSFTRYAALVVDQAVQMTPTDTFTRVQKMVASVQVQVSAVAVAISGVAKYLVSSVTTGVVGSAIAARLIAMGAFQSLYMNAAVLLGKIAAAAASQNVQVSVGSSFATFGEYANEERVMVVPQEDRDAEVV